MISKIRIILLAIICLLLTACSGQFVQIPTRLFPTVTPVLTVTVGPLSTKPLKLVTSTHQPIPTLQPSQSFTPVPSPTPFSDRLQPAIYWQLKAQFQVQAISFISKDRGWALINTQLIQTTDGGESWLKVSETPKPFYRLAFTNPTHG